jgi:hypothetical protein
VKHHTVALTPAQLAAIGMGRLVRLPTDHGSLTVGNMPGPGVARLWQVEQHQLQSGYPVEVQAPDLNALITFLPVVNR